MILKLYSSFHSLKLSSQLYCSSTLCIFIFFFSFLLTLSLFLFISLYIFSSKCSSFSFLSPFYFSFPLLGVDLIVEMFLYINSKVLILLRRAEVNRSCFFLNEQKQVFSSVHLLQFVLNIQGQNI